MIRDTIIVVSTTLIAFLILLIAHTTVVTPGGVTALARKNPSTGAVELCPEDGRLQSSCRSQSDLASFSP